MRCSRLLAGSFIVLTLSVVGLQPQAAQAASAKDMGAKAASADVFASIILKTRNTDLLESYVAATQDPTSPYYHQFVSVPTFVANCAPSDSDIQLLETYLASYNIRVTKLYADHLLIKAEGTVAAFNGAFAINIHNYTKGSQTFYRASNAPQVPFFLRNLLVALIGPTDEINFHSNLVKTNDGKHPGVLPHKPLLPAAGSTATGSPGDYTVGDVANLYDINPLYKAGIDGTGRTIGIATLANFLPSDAYAYWNLIGLKVLPNRITQVHLDGGGLLSAAAGSDETCLDVEQSGGIAPGAKMIVYDAPNNNLGFVDLFYTAASDNLVDSLSLSWGESELYYYAAVGGTDSTPQFVAFHQAFLEMAAQGISFFTSAGDSAAYDTQQGYDYPFNNVLSVDSPGNDPAVTAAGGTTVPFSAQFVSLPTAPPLNVYKEQVWGWDYIQNYFIKYGGPAYAGLFYPVGGGGGVSTFWPAPAYQSSTLGIRVTEPNQSVVYGGEDLIDLPAGFAGRNVPDVSLNADPYSGYELYCSQDGGLIDFYGGTSFVAPQLNGISALVSQANSGKRLGLWNSMLYRFRKTYPHVGASPLVDISLGDNWFYNGLFGYDPGAGLGVLDVNKFTQAVLLEAK